MRSIIRNFIACVATLSLFAGTAAWARQATITTHDGKQLTGELVSENDQAVVLIISNIRTPISRDNVAKIEYLKTTEEQFRERRASLEDKDVKGRYELAHWAYEQQAYDLAAAELAQLDEQYPEHPENKRVKLLIRVVEERQKLLAEPTEKDPVKQPTVRDEPTQKTPKNTGSVADLADERLTDEQINLIRVYEIDLTTQPKVIVPREVDDTVLENYRQSEHVPTGLRGQGQYRSMKGWQKLDILFKLQARSLYPLVDVREDPPALMDFKRRVHQRYVLNHCGTTQCHGGADAQDLFLFRTSASSDRTVYSNFYIVDSYKNQSGRMIDRNHPEESLLVEYGIPRRAARQPHPDVPGFHPAFREDYVNDEMYKIVTEWIDTLYKPRPEYGIDWQAPQPWAVSTTPAATPAAEE